VSKAIISATKTGASFDSILDELCQEARGEAGPGGKRRYMKRDVWQKSDYDRHFRELLSKQIKEYYEGQWEILNFVDIPVSIASRLTDDDIKAILVCIGAKHKLKRLNLTHCFNVVGHGLEPLRSSTVLERLDLGLYRDFETPFFHSRGGRVFFREIKLSEDPVCDILDSMLHEGGSSLRRLQYPWEWDLENQIEQFDNDIVNGNMEEIMTNALLVIPLTILLFAPTAMKSCVLSAVKQMSAAFVTSDTAHAAKIMDLQTR